MKILAIVVAFGALIYLALCAFIWAKQDSLIFFRQPLIAEQIQLAQRTGAQALELKNAQGLWLRGWWRKAQGVDPAPLLIYFGGNAEEVSGMLVEFQRYPKMHVALFNYRGYGSSEGDPSEHALLDDALFLHDTLSRTPEVARDAVVVMGRSLGSGVATHVAAARKVRAVILVSPYDSLRDIAAKIYPWLPVGLLMRHPFDSLSRAPGINAPMLALVGTRDTVVPPAHSQRLHDAWKGRALLRLLQGADHNDMMDHPEFWPSVDSFLRAVE